MFCKTLQGACRSRESNSTLSKTTSASAITQLCIVVVCCFASTSSQLVEALSRVRCLPRVVVFYPVSLLASVAVSIPCVLLACRCFYPVSLLALCHYFYSVSLLASVAVSIPCVLLACRCFYPVSLLALCHYLYSVSLLATCCCAECHVSLFLSRVRCLPRVAVWANPVYPNGTMIVQCTCMNHQRQPHDGFCLFLCWLASPFASL
jgi:hypothetical protein